jgi:GNAT superfamily N-acetyltransferase
MRVTSDLTQTWPVTDDGVLAAADRNMVTAWLGIVSVAPSPGIAEEDGLLLLRSGVPVSLFNPAFVTAAPADPAATVDKIVEHYKAHALPFVLYFRDEVAPNVAGPAEAAGLVEHFRPPLMVLDPIPGEAAQAKPDNLRISTLDESNLDGYGSVLSEGFGMPRDIVEQILGTSLLRVDGLTGFLGTIDGEPVGTSGLFDAHGLAGVYNVATVPAARGKGVGAALTWAAALAGAATGASVSVLQASEAGMPVYERMGYRTATRYRQFERATA